MSAMTTVIARVLLQLRVSACCSMSQSECCTPRGGSAQPATNARSFPALPQDVYRPPSSSSPAADPTTDQVAIIKSRDDAVEQHIPRPAIELEPPRSLDLLALRQESRATSQRFPSLSHVLWTIEHTIIVIQTEDWKVVGAIVVVQEPLRSLREPTKEPRLVKRRKCRIRDH